MIANFPKEEASVFGKDHIPCVELEYLYLLHMWQ